MHAKWERQAGSPHQITPICRIAEGEEIINFWESEITEM